MHLRKLADRYGLTVLTAAFAVSTGVAAVFNASLGIALSVGGAIASAAVDIAVRYRGESRHEIEVAAAQAELGAAASRFRTKIVGGPPFGGTSVLESALAVDPARLAVDILAGRFNFLPPDRWQKWGQLGTALRSGATEFVLAANSIQHLPSSEQRRAHALGEDAKKAASYARAVGSAYANYDLDEDPPVSRYRAADVEVDLSMLAAYRSLGERLTSIAAELEAIEGVAAPD